MRVFTWVVYGIIGAALALGTPTPGAQAQSPDEVVWLQIEAQPSQVLAAQKAAEYQTQFPDVAGFSLGGNWYGVMLGPYLRSTAEDVRDDLLLSGRIPYDAYITAASVLGPQFWPATAPATAPATETNAPVGSTLTAPNVSNLSDVVTPTVFPTTAQLPPPTAAQTVLTQTQATVPTTSLPDETRRQALASEAALSREEKLDLQRALRAEGFYQSAIDGAFGPGTRASMAAWQEVQGVTVTGVLTTTQRADLMRAYAQPLTSVGVRSVRDEPAGIEINIPMGVVEFTGHSAPFSQFNANGTLPGAGVLLISSPGDARRLAALYDVIQTLPALPPEGPRRLRRGAFEIEGANAALVTHAEARLEGSEIKGFILIWPQGDEKRRLRVLGAMQASFTRLDGTLPDVTRLAAPQFDTSYTNPKPKRSASGAFVDMRGYVLTAASVVEGCTRVTLGDGAKMEVSVTDSQTGLALLAPSGHIAPVGVVQFATQSAADGTSIAVSGYPFEGALGAPSLSFGKVQSRRLTQANGAVLHLALDHKSGDVGGAVITETGQIAGVLLAGFSDNQRLPDGVSVAVDASAALGLITSAGLTPSRSPNAKQKPVNQLGKTARDFTALIQCW